MLRLTKAKRPETNQIIFMLLCPHHESKPTASVPVVAILEIARNSFDFFDPDTEKPAQGRSFSICVPPPGIEPGSSR